MPQASRRALRALVGRHTPSSVSYARARFSLHNGLPFANSSLHRHAYDYHFAVVSPSKLQVSGENGTVLFDFDAQGTFGFRLVQDSLVPIEHDGPFPHVPAMHAARNVGDKTYVEILFESKVSTNKTWPHRAGLLQRAQRAVSRIVRLMSRKGTVGSGEL